jgi:hypothetical protein
MAALTPLDGGRIKRGRASLIGGIAVGIAVLALWTVIALDLHLASDRVMFAGGAVSALVGLWIWKADL